MPDRFFKGESSGNMMNLGKFDKRRGDPNFQLGSILTSDDLYLTKKNVIIIEKLLNTQWWQ